MKLLNMILLTSGILGSGVCAGIAKRQKSNDICNTFAYNRPDGKEYARPDDVYKECVGAMAKNHCGDKFGHKQAVCFKKYCSAFGYCGRK
ncbi:hypothetical protein CF336_g5913 [Tilletia laevis]|uniref:Invertebrate defensins family profile domain-containing protein n=1 Tax=Tilletia caries TaxID=13290 RepID=A0A8T8T881_9BASI|nr:hypothetical protein CF336_g5913 [Tilletia laevis]KAE8194665.1 hypothetical protein CF335_g5289 [Tilletia laevis]KAE8256607.1 hypothetical protein A4X03_0g5236 [Tilletia caries]